METSTRLMTRSPVALARTALAVAARALPAYASKFSKHDFTQHQLFGVLVLMQFFKTDPRGIVQLLRDLSDLRAELGLNKIPHPTTLFYAQKRLGKKGAFSSCPARLSSWLPSGV
jgi:uncharacterized heparinase superfamily protein